MASNTPARSPSISPPSSPTTAPAQPLNPSNSIPPIPLNGQARTPTAPNPSVLSHPPPSQDTAANIQAPVRAPTAPNARPAASVQQASPPVSPVSQSRRGSRPQYYFQRLQSAFSPSTHDVKDYGAVPAGTARPYLHSQQRSRLWAKTWTEFLVTLILCITYFLILYLYHRSNAIDKKHRRIFNALVTSNSFFLGVNLSASLRSYAKMLRWNILASRYRTLKIFDLILGCDSVINVIKLIWHGRNKKHWVALNIFTSAVSVGALACLIVQLGIAFSVGIIGLTYNLDISNQILDIVVGETSVINLQALSDGRFLSNLASINIWGIKGDGIIPGFSPTLSYDTAAYGTYSKDENGNTRYYFLNTNADHPDEQSVSYRYIDCSVSCNRTIVTQGQYGRSKQISFANDNGNVINQTLYEAPGEGGLYVVANTNSTCGDRCTNIMLFQAAITPENEELYYAIYGVGISQATRFSCNVQLSNVLVNAALADPVYQIPPLISRMLAGTYGWSSNPLMDDKYLYSTYRVASEIGYSFVPEVLDVEQNIAQITMAGIQTMDGPNGIARQNITNGEQPVQVQVLRVRWWYCAPILIAIPVVQLITCAVVIATANRVIIKDDTGLAVAKVYWTLLNKLGQHGCLLDGDQLVQHLGENEFGKLKFVYGYREGRGNGLKHVDVFEEGMGCDPARSFPQGEYDGLGDGLEVVVVVAAEEDGSELRLGGDGLGEVKRRKRRGFDAREYF